jgi:hypothetical protein
LTINNDTDRRDGDANRDPISGAPGSHPAGTGVGVFVGGAAARAASRTEAGPVGTVVGAALGGLAGKGVVETIDPAREEAYWRENYGERAYVESGSSFDDYGPAYGFGVSSYGRYPGRRFDEVEPALSGNWTASRGASSLCWDRARHAAQDAWARLGGTV